MIASELSDFSRVLSEHEKVLKQNRAPEELLRLIQNARLELKSDTFRLMVCGGFSRGKSAVINALLGVRLLPEDPTPTTSLLTEICYGDPISVEILDTGGNVIRQFCCPGLTEARNIVREWGTELNIPQDNPSSQTRKMLRVHYPSQYLKDGLILQDTPGFDSVIERHDQEMLEAINKGDGFLLVLATQPPYGRTDKTLFELVREKKRWISILVNKIDQIEFNDRELTGYIEYVQKNTGLPRERILSLSAWTALCGEEQNRPAEIEKSKIRECREKIFADLMKNSKNVIRLPVIQQQLTQGIQKSLADIEYQMSIVNREASEMDKLVSSLETEMKSLERKCNDTLTRTRNEINGICYRRTSEIESLAKERIERILQMNDTDLIKTAAEDTGKSIAKSIEAYACSCQEMLNTFNNTTFGMYQDSLRSALHLKETEGSGAGYAGAGVISGVGGAVLMGSLMSTPTLLGSAALASLTGISTGAVFSMGAALASGGILIPVALIGGMYFAKRKKVNAMKEQAVQLIKDASHRAVYGRDENQGTSLSLIRDQALAYLEKSKESMLSEIQRKHAEAVSEREKKKTGSEAVKQEHAPLVNALNDMLRQMG
ncbi:MAG: dynamin family protein [Desulfococcaceae bacterium]|jgi:GTPase SAR1 family protein|nr:dynamin family protein [Desulfococcaceae bacterium]